MCLEDEEFDGPPNLRGKIMMYKGHQNLSKVHKIDFFRLARYPIFKEACTSIS